MWFSGLAKRHNLSERLAETISDDRKAASTAENAESLFQKIELILSVHKLVISNIYAVDEVGGRLVRQRKLKKLSQREHNTLARVEIFSLSGQRLLVRLWHVWAEMER